MQAYRQFRDWVERIGEGRLAAFGLAVVLAITLFSLVEPSQAALKPMRFGDGVTTGDVVLYRRVVETMQAGEGYYQAVAQLHRELDYPLKPFVTVRLPTLAFLHATLGINAMMVLLGALIVACPIVWSASLRAKGYRLAVCAPMIGLLAFAGAVSLSTSTSYFQEVWVGLLLATALALDGRRFFWAQLAIVLLAVLIRELVFPFLLIMLAHAIVHRERRHAMAVVGAMALVGVMLVMHKLAIDAVLRPGDQTSGGWGSMRGPLGFVRDIAFLCNLENLPVPLSTLLTLSPLAGWLAYGLRDDFRAFLWFLGFATVIAVLARGDNFYWAQIMLPAYILGWPLLFIALWRGFRRSPQPVPSPAV